LRLLDILPTAFTVQIMAVLNKMPYSVRLAFNFKNWQPSENEWCQAIIQLQPEERERIKKFRYRDDAKASLIENGADSFYQSSVVKVLLLAFQEQRKEDQF